MISKNKKSNKSRRNKYGLDRQILQNKDLPNREGVYLVSGAFGDYETLMEIDVYRHPRKGLCCFSEDFGSGGIDGVDDKTDCHVSVQFTGLEFIRFVRNF